MFLKISIREDEALILSYSTMFPSSFLSHSFQSLQHLTQSNIIFEKANHILPKSFSDAPKYIQLSAASDQQSAIK
jgi:hypothetical protein